MPYIHERKDGTCGALNNSLTVRELMGLLYRAIKKDPSVLDKAVLVSDDEECNGYHGVYCAISTDAAEVKGCINASCWGKVEDDVYEHAILIH